MVAERSLRQSVEAFRELGDGRSEADVLGTLSELAARQGRLAEAADLLAQSLDRFQHALDLHRDLEHPQGVVACLEGLTRIAEAGGDAAAAHRRREELGRCPR